MKKIDSTTLKPDFLMYNFNQINLQFPLNDNYNSLKDEERRDNLIENFAKENTIILYNGKAIYNSLNKNVEINADYRNYFNSKNLNELEKINSKNLNSFLKIEIQKNLNIDINIIIAISKNTAHNSQYIVNNNSFVNFSENYILYDNAYLNYNLDAQVLADASLNLSCLQDIKTNNSVYFKHNINVFKNAVLNFYYFNLNEANVINDTKINLLESFSKANIKTLTYANENFEVGNLINLEHLSKDSYGNIYNVGIVNDYATLNIDATNKINKDMSKSESSQESKIINLSDTCKSVANPQLIIDNYDVKAGHSVAVGQIEEDQLYYLMSRGLTKGAASNLIITGLADTVLQGISSEDVINKVKKLINNKLV